jgi:hypothetical protein
MDGVAVLHQRSPSAVVIVLPDELDFTNADSMRVQLRSAFAPAWPWSSLT